MHSVKCLCGQCVRERRKAKDDPTDEKIVIDPAKHVPRELCDIVLSMLHSGVHDYVIPGLTSSLVGGEGRGKVRAFTQERHHDEPISPHSHRFDFACLVLKGTVRNRVWTEQPNSPAADPYRMLTLRHLGEFGKYTITPNDTHHLWDYEESTYRAGDWYSMKAEDVHNIFFSKGAVVLFFEGPHRYDTSHVLEPVSGGRVLPTFTVEPWMFRRDDAPAA